MLITGIDELNTLSKPPKEYFGEMNLTEEQMDERIRFTEQANEELLGIMELIVASLEFGEIDYDFIQETLEERWLEVIGGFVVIDDYLRQYASDYAMNFIEATKENIADIWFLSEDRALFNAENGANDTMNYKEYVDAIKRGYKAKRWVTERDRKVRKTHAEVEGKVVGIMDYFEVGGVLMRFPKDYEMAFDAPHETVNCRCVVKYLKR